MKIKSLLLTILTISSVALWGQNDDIVISIKNQRQDSTHFSFDIYASTTGGTTYFGDADLVFSSTLSKWSSLAATTSNGHANLANLSASVVGGNIVVNFGGDFGATSVTDFPEITTTPVRLATINVTDVNEFMTNPSFDYVDQGTSKTIIYEVYLHSNGRLRQSRIFDPELETSSPALAPGTPANFVADMSTAGQAVLSWDAVTDSVLIVAREGSAIATGPLNTVTYDGDTVYGNGEKINIGASVEYVVGKFDGSTTGATITGLTAGTTYHFAIYSFAGGNGFSERYGTAATAEAVSLFEEPASEGSNLVFSNILPTSFDIAWDQGDGDNVLIVVRALPTGATAPTDTVVYDANTSYSAADGDSTATGNIVVFSGAYAGTFSVTGLTPGVQYAVDIYDYNGSGAGVNYLSTALSGSQYSMFDEPSTAFAGITVNATSANDIEVTWTDPSEANNNWLIVARLSTDGATRPDSGHPYTANTGYGDGSALGNGFVVYNGDGTSESVTVSGLDQNETYAFDIYAYTGSSASDTAVLNYSNAVDGNGSDVTWLETSLVAFLEGPYDGTDMSSVNITVPSAQPYNTAPWNYAGTESNGSLPGNVVDWVLLELRTGDSAAAASTVEFTQAALLLEDGSIVAADGSSTPIFEITSEDNYYIAIRHRNHLAVSSDTTLADNGENAFTYNFSTAGATGTDAMFDYNGDGSLYVLFGGWVDPTTDATINSGDYSAVYTDRNNGSATYDATDANMDGLVNASDRSVVFNNRDYSEQLP